MCQLLASGPTAATWLAGGALGEAGAAEKGAEGDGPRLLCGVASVDITPEHEARIEGAGVKRFAQRVLDPLHAKAIVFSDGRKKVCFVSVDVIIITKQCADRIRQAAKDMGFDPAAVMVHATQTHAAPSLGAFHLDPDFPLRPASAEWLRSRDERFEEQAIPRTVEAIRKADADLQPATVTHGRAIEGRVAFNRRAVTVDGSGVFMPPRQWPQPLGPVRMSHLEGPIDPEVAALVVRGEDGRVRSLLLHHTCHPVCTMARGVISADWPGAWCRAMEPIAGSQCLPVVVNGCCGNINPWDPFDPNHKDDHERIGKTLAETTANLLRAKGHLHSAGPPIVDYCSQTLEWPFRRIDPERMAEARAWLRRHPEVQWADKQQTRIDGRWFRAAMLVCVELQRQREKQFRYEIQAFRIGNVAIVGWPGEPFVEGQLAIKQASPAQRTIVAHCVNQYVGYIPTRRAFEYPEGRRGHEVNTSTWSKLPPDALDQIVTETTTVLRRVMG